MLFLPATNEIMSLLYENNFEEKLTIPGEYCFYRIFYGCTSLTDVGGFTGLKLDIDFHYSPLTHDSALNVIDNLAVSPGHKVIFNNITFDTLTPEDIAKATSKGWTITRTYNP